MTANRCSSPTGAAASRKTPMSSSRSRAARRATISRSAGSTPKARPTPPRRRSANGRRVNVRSAIHFASAALALAVLASTPAIASDKIDPVADAKAFQKFFKDKFPKLTPEDFVNGPYSMNEDLHRQWVEKEQFPPYEFSVEMGKEMFSKPFKNGKSYADCFPNKGIGIRQNYPYFDDKEGKVVTLELALNRCR